MIRVAGCFMESGGQILHLLRIKKNGLMGSGKWGIPLDMIRRTETPESAVIGQLSREIGLRISLQQLEALGRRRFGFLFRRFEFFGFKVHFPFKPEITLSSDYKTHVWIQPKYACSLVLMRGHWEVIKWAYQL